MRRLTRQQIADIVAFLSLGIALPAGSAWLFSRFMSEMTQYTVLRVCGAPVCIPSEGPLAEIGDDIVSFEYVNNGLGAWASEMAFLRGPSFATIRDANGAYWASVVSGNGTFLYPLPNQLTFNSIDLPGNQTLFRTDAHDLFPSNMWGELPPYALLTVQITATGACIIMALHRNKTKGALIWGGLAAGVGTVVHLATMVGRNAFVEGWNYQECINEYLANAEGVPPACEQDQSPFNKYFAQLVLSAFSDPLRGTMLGVGPDESLVDFNPYAAYMFGGAAFALGSPLLFMLYLKIRDWLFRDSKSAETPLLSEVGSDASSIMSNAELVRSLGCYSSEDGFNDDVRYAESDEAAAQPPLQRKAKVG